MVQADPRPARTTRGHRFCFMCDRKIRSDEGALRCANIEPDIGSFPAGRLRFWLCKQCADDVEQGIHEIRDRAGLVR